MNLPGFTAEASLRRVGTRHRAAGVPMATAGDGKIVPQIPIPRISCQREGTLVSLSGGGTEDYICCEAYGVRGCFWARRV